MLDECGAWDRFQLISALHSSGLCLISRGNFRRKGTKIFWERIFENIFFREKFSDSGFLGKIQVA